MISVRFASQNRRGLRLWGGRLLLTAVFLLVGCEQLSRPAEPVPTPTITPTAPPTETPPPTPTATPIPVNRFVSLTDDELGMTIAHPADWTVQDDPFLALASEADLLNEGARSEVNSGALIAINQAPPTLVGDDLAAELNAFMEQNEQFRVITPAENTTINGQEAATVEAVSLAGDGTEFTVVYTLVRDEGNLLFLSGLTPDFRTMLPLIEAIVNTIDVYAPPPPAPPTPPPTPTPAVENSTPFTATTSFTPTTPITTGVSLTTTADLSGTVTIPADFAAYQNDDLNLTLGYPQGWLVDDDHDNAVMFASSEALLRDNAFAEVGGGTVWLFTDSVATPEPPDPLRVLEQFALNFTIYDALTVLSPIQAQPLNGRTIATSRYDAVFSGSPIIVDYYAVVDGSQFVVLVVMMADDSFERLTPVGRAMAATVTIR